MTAQTVTAAGRHIEARFIPGSANAPVLVLLHEGLGSIDLWKNVPDELAAQTRCPVLVYSRYGNGFSEVLGEPRPVTYMHDEARSALPEVLDAFGVRDAILIGHSDGASIALIYAGTAGARVRGVVVEAPHVFVEDLSVESIARAKLVFEGGALREKLRRYHRDVDRTFYGWNDIWLSPGFRSWDIRGALPEIRVPVLIIQGERDEYGTIAQISAIRKGCSDARVDSLYLAECGHAPHRDRPGATLDAIASFVSQSDVHC